jgi:hypothetical protein
MHRDKVEPGHHVEIDSGQVLQAAGADRRDVDFAGMP